MTRIEYLPDRHHPNNIIPDVSEIIHPFPASDQITLVEDFCFPHEDEWGIFFRKVIAKKVGESAQSLVNGTALNITEFGIGNGINIGLSHHVLQRFPGVSCGRVVGVDVRPDILDAAYYGITNIGIEPELWRGGAIEWINNLKTDDKINGLVFMCLP